MNHSIAALCLIASCASVSAAPGQEAQAAATSDRPCVTVALPAVTAPDDVDASALSVTLQSALLTHLALKALAPRPSLLTDSGRKKPQPVPREWPRGSSSNARAARRGCGGP